MEKRVAVKKVLFITLSNIGDVILSLPVLDALQESFPGARFTVVAGARPKELFENNPVIDKIIVFDKRATLKQKIDLFFQLKKEEFDLVIDLRNSLYGLLLPVRCRLYSFGRRIGKITHMKDIHIARTGLQKGSQHKTLQIGEKDKARIDTFLQSHGVVPQDTIIVLAAGAKSHTKRWPKEKFSELASLLFGEFRVKIVLVGDKDDISASAFIALHSRIPLIDLTGKTTLKELAALFGRAQLVITNDSAVLHMASYLDVPVVSLFGPTDESKYGPWSEHSEVVKKDIFCRPCEKAQCESGTLRCLHVIKVEDVMRKVRKILSQKSILQTIVRHKDYKRILVVRTDRIGDVLLSTPVIQSLREAYPDAYIAMMVSPYAKEAVEGNPFLDEVILFDKDYAHKNFSGTIAFARYLSKKKFDLALILHPTNRAHLVTFLAGIPERIGYDRKLGFLLTERMMHTKQLGEKHESEYALDLVRLLGIEPLPAKVYMPIKKESEEWIEKLLFQEGIKAGDSLLGIHPAASCPSKIWPVKRFAETADRLAELYGMKILVFSGAKDTKLAQEAINYMKHKAVNLAGKTSVSQLASALKRCALCISNDSGPVHIASAVGVPVIAIFGRDQKGLSPKRWGPLGVNDKILHKPAGCLECLAHNCIRKFACLNAISVDDVIACAKTVLGEPQT